MVAYYAACAYFACHLTVIQTRRFLENQDTPTIDFKLFNDSPDDKYPVFSICFEGAELRWYNHASIFESFEVVPNEYSKILKGEEGIKYEYDYNTRLYKKISIDIRNGSLEDFDQLSLRISDVLTGLEYVNKQDDLSVHFGNGMIGNQSNEIPFRVGYTTPDMICFTRKQKEHLETSRVYDLIAFNLSVFDNVEYRNVNFQVFIHYPGQLLRAFHKPTYKSNLALKTKIKESNPWDKLLKFKLEEVTVLRKRPDANVPCDINNDVSDDVNFHVKIMKNVGCVPIYWKQFAGEVPTLSGCQLPSEYQDIYYYIKHYDDVLQSYDAPCVDMQVQSKLDKEEENKWEAPTMKFLYTNPFYLSIDKSEAFGFESFVSGVGGFVGIFLGYSMLQFPEFLMAGSSRSREILKSFRELKARILKRLRKCMRRHES